METEYLNRLYLELSQFVTAKSAREISIEKVSEGRIEFIEHIYQHYGHLLNPKDRAIITALLEQWKPQIYAQY